MDLSLCVCVCVLVNTLSPECFANLNLALRLLLSMQGTPCQHNLAAPCLAVRNSWVCGKRGRSPNASPHSAGPAPNCSPLHSCFLEKETDPQSPNPGTPTSHPVWPGVNGPSCAASGYGGIHRRGDDTQPRNCLVAHRIPRVIFPPRKQSTALICCGSVFAACASLQSSSL